MTRRPQPLASELIQFCKTELADVKCPRSIDFRTELPRHPTGKLYKRLLKDEYWQAAAAASDRTVSGRRVVSGHAAGRRRSKVGR